MLLVPGKEVLDKKASVLCRNLAHPISPHGTDSRGRYTQPIDTSSSL